MTNLLTWSEMTWLVRSMGGGSEGGLSVMPGARYGTSLPYSWMYASSVSRILACYMLGMKIRSELSARTRSKDSRGAFIPLDCILLFRRHVVGVRVCRARNHHVCVITDDAGLDELRTDRLAMTSEQQ